MGVSSKLFLLLTLVCVSSLAFAQDRRTEINAAAERARQDLAQHDLQKAVQEYARILQLDPSDAEIYTAEGVALYGLHSARRAAQALQTALSIDPNQSTAALFLGLTMFNLGRCKEAIPLLQKHFTLETAPKLRRIVGLSLLGCYRNTGRFEEALELVATLEKSYPADADILYNAAELYTQLWDVAASKLIKDHPESYRVHQLAGEVLEAQGQYGRAIKEYRLALQENNEIPNLRYRIGKMILDQGGPGADERAMAYFQQELANNPDDPAAEYSIGEILRQQRRLADAEQYFRRALNSDPGLVEAHIGLGQTFLQEHQLEPAERELQKAIQLRPDDPTAHYDLMTVYRDLGKKGDAVKEMAMFQKLNLKKQQDFRSRLHALLTGKNSLPEPAH